MHLFGLGPYQNLCLGHIVHDAPLFLELHSSVDALDEIFGFVEEVELCAVVHVDVFV